ncbi:restriction endonuclease subunit S [Chelatococcus daeguensis]|uniref:restriction endonuclease subunit S n=1 Tax=Chelatococcus daeguensis TaxID=444444 RepID=UPI000903FDEF|nr:restriction endonuclease subunit S [Chelatococcus daeguensis]
MAGESQALEVDRGWLFHPVFPQDWQRSPLYPLAQWVNGIAFRDIQFSASGRPVIKIAEIKGGISEQTKFTEQTFDESVLVRSGDLLFSWSGQPETSIDAFWWRGPEGWLNQHVFKVTPREGIDATFFFYLLRYLKPNFVGIARNKQTTGLGHVTKRDLETIVVGVPDSAEQRAIAHILGALDDKIELNRKMAATLEAMARAIFKAWFVDFEPVRAKQDGRDPGLPPRIADLFPDRLVETEEDEIPEGWQWGTVADVLELAYGKALKATDRRPGPFPVYGSGGINGYHDSALVGGPAIIVGRKGSVGTIYWEDDPCFPIDTVFYVVPRLALTFCFYLLETQGLQGMNTDAAVPGLNRSNVYRLEVVIPDGAVVKEFDQIARNLRSRIRIAREEERTLAALRDTLLPKLISGELRVKDAKKFLERAL